MTALTQIQPINPADAPQLLTLSRDTFFDAFAHLNNPDDMEAYASKAFTLPKLQQELNNPDSYFYYALYDNEVAGYLKLNRNAAQTEFGDTDALEVERIYVLNKFQGKQIGGHLLNFAIQTAINAGLKQIWLGVWENNAGAIRFYQKNGFEQFSSHSFMLGNDKQTDILMKRPL
ncbi:GNAT family N-acetyltransferase [Inquilinus sp. KBS0705]|nr:GNAT family N-acetyltransferase [Inquilinus sp. KBS0705]